MNCVYCKEPITSDDFKEDKVILSTNKEAGCHERCFEACLKFSSVKPAFDVLEGLL